MKRLRPASSALFLAALFLAACATAPPPPPPAPAPAPEPEPEAAPQAPSERPTYLVKADKTQLRDDPTTKASVLARLSKNTRVTGLNEKDGWIFVRLPDNRVGWIRADLLRRDAPCPSDQPWAITTPPPLTMSEAPGAAKGRVVVEGSVDAGGNVTAVRITENPTGSAALAERASRELRGMRFTAPVKNCRPQPFTYVYTRTF